MTFNSKTIIILFLVLSILLVVPTSAAITWTEASGCWTATNGSYKMVMWNTTGASSWSVPADAKTTVDIMVIGGGGGSSSGGGGAGGVAYQSSRSLATGNTTIKITVGTGGTGVVYSAAGNSGTGSMFDNITALGGGGGGSNTATPTGIAGGSGGGGGAGATLTSVGGNGIQNNSGGATGYGYAGKGNGGFIASPYPSGSGGGAGSVGGNAAAAVAGNGGAGISLTITTETVCYAGGGGGGIYTGGTAGTATCGGGSGQVNNNGISATNGTGGGGGGTVVGTGGTGGTGIVIVKYIPIIVDIPLSTFTYNIQAGATPPINVQFNDTSSVLNKNTWAWYAYNSSGNNTAITFSTIQNASFTFPIGDWRIALNTSNASFYNISTQVSFVNISVKQNDVWYSQNGHYVRYNGTNSIIEMWNNTGIYSWSTPTDVFGVQYVVVGGGGGGGGAASDAAAAGGGGAGGYLAGTNISVTGTINVTVGAGGAGAGSAGNTVGIQGGYSNFSTIWATGGGGGGSYGGGGASKAGGFGGSGGGSVYGGTIGAAISGQGRAGGLGTSASAFGGGGGGGNLSVGGDGSTTKGGNGGTCNVTMIAGYGMNLSGGGGGGIYVTGTSGGLGACFIGGNGGDGSIGLAGVNETGGGGGGAGSATGSAYAGGLGGSGIVLIKYTPEAPTASFTYSPNSGTTPQLVTFNDTTSVVAPTTWQWNWTGYGTNTTSGTFATSKNATASFTTGNYSIKLNVSSARGSYNVSAQNSWVNITAAQVLSGFTANTTSGLFPLHVGFNVTNKDNASIWNWSFGDGTWQNGTTQNATKIYSSGGTYTVTEIANDGATSNTTIKLNYITVQNTTVSSWTSNVTSGIIPFVVLFNDTAPNLNATTWNWTTNSQYSSLRNTTITYSTVGTYSVNHSANNTAYINWTNQSNYITSYAKPVISFSANVTTGTFPPNKVILFNDTSGWKTPTMWNYSMGDGTWVNSTTTGNFTKTYSVYGTYTVGLNLTNGSTSNFTQRLNYIVIGNKTPIVNFTSNSTGGLYPTTVGFNTTGSISNNTYYWNWSFGDGTWTNTTTAATSNVSKTYSSGGKYSVSLYMTNDGGTNSTTKSNFITITNRTINNFTASNTSGVQPLVVRFTDTSYNATSWTWIFGDGNTSTQQSPLFIYNVPGTYSVNHSSSNGINHTFWTNTSNMITVTPPPPPVAAFTSNVTIGLNYGMYVNFTDTSSNSPTSWFWDFGDGGTSTLQHPQYVYDVARLYNVSLRATNAYGSDWENKTNYINLTTDLPNVGAWSHFDGANGGTIFIDEIGSALSSSGATTSSNQVKFGNASLYTSAGWNYISTPNSSRNWFGNGAFTLEGWMYPTSTGAGNELWQSKTNRFLSQGWGLYHGNSSTASNDWHFFMGNSAVNSTSAFTIPLNTWTHVAIQRYTNGTVFIYLNGNYTTSKSMSGIFDTSNPYRIGRQGTGANSNSFVGYTDEARGSNIVRWFGNFTPPTEAYRDGTTIPDINPSSTFRFKTDSGGIADIYNQTNSGVRNRTIQIQNVNNATYIVGSMTYDQDHLFLKNIYANKSTWNDITIVSYTIFNEGGLLEFNLTRPGGFAPGTSRASVLDTQMLYWNYTQYPTSSSGFFGFGVLINGSTGETYPVHNFIETALTYGGWDFYPNFTSNVTTGFAPLSVQFNDTTIGYPNIWNWSWGDGTWTNGSAINAPVHTYTSVGNYTVNMSGTIWQNMSVVNSTYKTNYIQVTEPSPVANFTQNQTAGLYILAVQFNDTSSNTPKSWNWSFGDGTLSTLQNPIKVFSTGGLYQINLTVNNSNATYSMKLSSVEVWNRTSNTFTANNLSGNVSLYTTFTDVSTNATSWFWDFGNGNTSTTKSPSFVYTTVGIYSVNHSSSNTNHTFWTNKSNYITVYPPFVESVISNFTANQTTGVRPLSVLFTDLSSNTPTTWNWSFGDNNYSTSQNPVYTYQYAGTYTVTSNASNANQTYFPMTKVGYITVTAIPPNALFTGTPTSGFIPLNVTFISTSTGDPPLSYNWSFGDGNYSTAVSPTYGYYTAGLYTVNLTVVNVAGTSTLSKPNYINASYPVPKVDFVANETFGYIPFYVHFTDLSTGYPATSWNWSFGDGNYSTLQNPDHQYSGIALYTVSLTATNYGGSNTSTKINYINSTAIVSAPIASFNMNVSSGAPPLGVGFTDTSLFGPTAWNWSFGDGNYSELQFPQHLYSGEGVYYIKLNASNAFGFNSTQKTLYVTLTPVGGGGGSSGSSSNGIWIDPNTILAALVMGVPGAAICLWLVVSGKRREERY